jgi:hypothetical protein
MPLFILISGYLFWLTRIAKEKEYKFVVVDKLKRLGIPFVFFTILGFLTKYLSSQYIKHPVDETGIAYFLNIFLGLKPNPLNALWFVYVIFIMMCFYPLYKYSLKSKYLIGLIVIVGVILYYKPIGIHLFMINKLSKLFIYFFTGILIGKFKLDEYVKADIKYLLFFVVLYISTFVLYYNNWLPIPTLFLSLLGIVMAFHFAKYAEKEFPSIFISFRFNTYQIYLMSVFPQMAIEMIYRHTGGQFFVLFYFANIFIGLYFPILVVNIVNKYNLRLLKPFIGL